MKLEVGKAYKLIGIQDDHVLDLVTIVDKSYSASLNGYVYIGNDNSWYNSQGEGILILSHRLKEIEAITLYL